MKKEERIAQAYLQAMSNDVIYEPDGNTPPDFKINKLIAVEVRRLNRTLSMGGKQIGIEQAQFKVPPALNRVFREFDSSVPTDNYRILLSYRRPIGKISKIESVARTELQKFLMTKPQTPLKINLSDNVSITISKTNRTSAHVFYIGTGSDKDAAGFIAEMYIENINHCIAEKTNKIQQYKDKYPEWWLVLVDFLVGGIGEPEKTIVIQNIINIHGWKKVIVIHPETKRDILRIEH